MNKIVSTDLLDFLELNGIFDFSKNNCFLHHLCNTTIDITSDSGEISYNKTTSGFHCLNVIAYESLCNTDINIILFYDMNRIIFTTDNIKADLIKIKGYLQKNYPNYQSIKSCVIKYLSQAQKNSTRTQKCIENYQKEQQGLITLLNLCIKMSSVESCMVKL